MNFQNLNHVFIINFIYYIILIHFHLLFHFIKYNHNQLSLIIIFIKIHLYYLLSLLVYFFLPEFDVFKVEI